MPNKNGQNTIMTPDLVAKLFEAFAYGLTDAEACLYCGINDKTMYSYFIKHPDQQERKELVKKKPIMRAKLNVVNSIDSGDLDISKWYLERKVKEEFSLKQEYELSNKDDKPFEVTVNIVR